MAHGRGSVRGEKEGLTEREREREGGERQTVRRLKVLPLLIT
jgi:hypothetical protein